MSPILELNAVRYRYPGSVTPALQGVNLRIPSGRKVALLGRNGSGKSTLMLTCNGILRPESGQVCLDGRPVADDRGSMRELRRTVGIVFQNPDDQLFSASVAEDISLGPLNLGLSESDARRRVQQAAEMCEIADLLDRPTHALSGGQKTRVALAGVLAMDVEILIADEALAGLDPWMRYQVLAIFDRLIELGKTIVLATHDLELARTWPDLVVLMEHGRLVTAASPESFFADRNMVARICPPALRTGGHGGASD